MRAGWLRLILVALVLGACTQPPLVRDGVQISYESAAEADLHRARGHLAAQQPEQARPLLEGFLDELARSRHADEALFLLGEVDLHRGDPERAVLVWRRLLERHSRSRRAAETRLRLAELYRQLGRPEIGRAVLAEARFERAGDRLRVRMYRLLADLARMEGDYAEAVRALSYALRDTVDAGEFFEIDLELEELIADRLRDSELEALVDRLVPGPVFDQVLLEIARRALGRGEFQRAIASLDRLPRRLRPRDQLELERIRAQARAGAQTLMYSLGLAVPLSGPYASFGESVLRGVTLALGLFHDPPGRYRLLIRDTAGELERGAEVVEELVHEEVSALIGPMRSIVAARSAPLAEQARVPLLTLAPREDLAFLGRFIFLLGLTAGDQVRVLVDHAIHELDARRFAILYPMDDYGRTFKNLFWDQVEQLGGSVVGVEGYPPDAVDLQLEIKKLIGLHYISKEQQQLLDEREQLLRSPADHAERLEELAAMELPPYVDFDALFIPDVAQKVGLILPQLRFYDVRDVAFLGPRDWNDEALVEIAGRDASGVLFTDAFHAASQDPTVAEFVARYQAEFGRVPDLFAAQGYDAAVILRTLIDSAGQMSRERLRQDLLEMKNFPGVSGLTSFDETGAARKVLHILTVHRGVIRDVDELP